MRAKSCLSVLVGLAMWSGCQCADGIPDPADARRDASVDAFAPVDANLLDVRAFDTPVVDARHVCASAMECQDTTFCNGAERCAPSDPEADMNGCAPAIALRCTATQTCDETRDMCLTQCDLQPDADGDMHNAVACGGDDCDDSIPSIYPGAVEVCDGVDQNCAMGSDEGFNLGASCDPAGVCGMGVVECLPSMLAGCSTGPGGSANQSMAERCNTLDDDCDGAIDETFALGDACDGVGECGAGFRECASDGTAHCSSDRGGSIDGSRPELCDMLDQDCDGNPLNGLNVGGPCDGVGLCGAGVIECASTGSSRCSTDPTGTQDQSRPEACDGFDNNCNGVNDDGNPGAGVFCGTAFSGICSSGRTACTAGATTCIPDFTPGTQPEFCDLLDNDCNGMADDRSPNVMCPAQFPAASFVTNWNCSGTCSVGSCSAGHANVDGAVGNGCECVTDSYANACGAAAEVTIPVSGSMSMIGKVETAGGADFLRVTFAVPSVGSPYHPRITLADSGGGQYAMSILSDCSTAAGCSTTGGVNNENGNRVTTWEQNYNGYVAGAGCCSDNTPRVSSMIISVFRSSGDAPTCTSYTVTITNS